MKLQMKIVILCLLVLLTSCNGKRELNELGIVLAMGIDRKDDKYLISLQLVNPSAIASQGNTGNRSTATVYTASGKTIFEAIRRLTKETPRKNYFAHLRILILSEDLARQEGIGSVLDLMVRDPEFRKDFYVLVSKGTSANNILSILSPIEKVPASKLFNSLETSEKVWAPSKAFTLDELIVTIARVGKEAALSGVQVKGSTQGGQSSENVSKIVPNATLSITNVAAFKEDKLIGWLNEKESKGYNYITDNVHSSIGSVPCPSNKQKKIDIEVVRSKTKMKARIENGTPIIDVNVESESNVGEVECKADLLNPKTIQTLEQSSNNNKKKMMEAALKKAQEIKSDIFGFGDLIYRKHPTEWGKLKTDWSEVGFLKAKVNFHVHDHINHLGTMNNSPLQRIQ